MKKYRSVILFLLLVTVKAGAQTDTLLFHIDSITVSTVLNSSPVRGNINKTLSIGMGKAAALPTLMGSADPLRYAQTLPGVQTNSEIDAGLKVLGCDNSHNFISIKGVPIYGANHMLGFFSYFNPVHYDRMDFSTSSGHLRLGGELNMERTDSTISRVHGNMMLGLISTQGGVSVPVGNKSSLTLSGRASLLNLLYKGQLKMGDSPFEYGFNDINLTFATQPSTKDRISIDFYTGNDKCLSTSKNFDFQSDMNWGNLMASARWIHDEEKFKSTVSAYFSGCHNDLVLEQEAIVFGLPSRLKNIGLNGQLDYSGWILSIGGNLYDIKPQYPMFNNTPIGSEQQERQKATEILISGKKPFEAGNWIFTPKLRASSFISSKAYFAIDPGLDIDLILNRYGKLGLSAGIDHQNLFQTGPVSNGYPVEFWFGAGQHSDPQRSIHTSLSYSIELGNGMYGLSSQVYFKRLYNQIEYTSGLYDILATGYSLDNVIHKGDGWNYGLLVMLQKRSGSLTGWISYSCGRALRRFEDSDTLIPSNHERIHELNAVATYKLGKWEFGANLVGSSGLPYTPIEGFCIIAGSIVTKYGERNSLRLPPYIRLDLSANYELPRFSIFSHKLCASIYNATCQHNTLLYILALKDDLYMLDEVTFSIPILPSLSYVINF